MNPYKTLVTVFFIALMLACTSCGQDDSFYQVPSDVPANPPDVTTPEENSSDEKDSDEEEKEDECQKNNKDKKKCKKDKKGTK